jgi:hypothetical protein
MQEKVQIRRKSNWWHGLLCSMVKTLHDTFVGKPYTRRPRSFMFQTPGNLGMPPALQQVSMHCFKVRYALWTTKHGPLASSVVEPRQKHCFPVEKTFPRQLSCKHCKDNITASLRTPMSASCIGCVGSAQEIAMLCKTVPCHTHRRRTSMPYNMRCKRPLSDKGVAARSPSQYAVPPAAAAAAARAAY